ncbi:VOC family protein [Paraferrimonas sedimenticola]|uniref:VOC family protein n=1 Tax=Paraferrimonas sedimenticola TaxID=375674 RepID=A0AA37RZ30_9GAMM|nr:VOC family protein [Paraferrimonas sedimenticola]GLP97984.1 VOC family protein [Paraferrimonas sedimenticola]
MALTWKLLFAQWPVFSERIEQAERQLGLAQRSWQIDHCALRVNCADNAQQLVDDFVPFGKVVSNKAVNGRPILLLQLDEPLALIGQPQRKIRYIELPFPKSKPHPIDGWEHVELVSPCDADSAQALELCAQQWVKGYQSGDASWGEFVVKSSCPKGEGEALANPSLAFKHKNGVCIKLHPYSLAQVLGLTQAS